MNKEIDNQKGFERVQSSHLRFSHSSGDTSEDTAVEHKSDRPYIAGEDEQTGEVRARKGTTKPQEA